MMEQRLLDIVLREPDSSELDEAHIAIIDTVAVAVAGWAEAQPVTHAISAGQVGTNETLAALALGTAAHVLDFDDTELVGKVHPSAALVAAGLSLGASLDRPANDVLASYCAGRRTAMAIGGLVQPSLSDRGYHPTAAVMPLAAAVTAGSLLGSPRDVIGHALAIATSFSAGTREAFGTLMKPFHAGLAAARGISAARLAAAGLVGPARALSGANGFVHTLSGKSVQPEELTEACSRARVLPKLYPCGHYAHAAIDAVRALKARHDWGANQVATITVDTTEACVRILSKPRPKTPLEAKFSMPYCVAVAALRGNVSPADFTLERFHDPAVWGLVDRVQVTASPDFADHGGFGAAVEVVLTDGKVLYERVDEVFGEPSRPVSGEAMREKLEGCLAFGGLDADHAEQLADCLRSFLDQQSARKLLRVLAASMSTPILQFRE